MKYLLESVSQNEERFLFALDETDAVCKHKIGYVRGDFGSTGTAFYHTWWPCNDEMNTGDFKAELQRVVDELRSDAGLILKDRRSMLDYCCKHSSNRIQSSWNTETFGFKVRTEKYMFYLRCFYGRGDYNFYIHCFTIEAEKMIYENENGGNIK